MVPVYADYSGHVTAIKKPFFDQPLCNASVPEGQGVRLECGFQAEPAPQITWLKDNVPIQQSNVINVSQCTAHWANKPLSIRSRPLLPGG